MCRTDNPLWGSDTLRFDKVLGGCLVQRTGQAAGWRAPCRHTWPCKPKAVPGAGILHERLHGARRAIGRCDGGDTPFFQCPHQRADILVQALRAIDAGLARHIGGGTDGVREIDGIGLVQRVNQKRIYHRVARKCRAYLAEAVQGATRIDRIFQIGEGRQQTRDPGNRCCTDLGNIDSGAPQLVGHQKTGTGLSGQNADAGRGRRCEAGIGQCMCRIDQRNRTVHDNGAGLSQSGAGQFVSTHQVAGVGFGKAAEVGFADRQNHDGFARDRPADCIEQHATVGHPFQMDRDHVGGRIFREVIDGVGDRDIGAVPNPDRQADAQALLIGHERHRDVDSAGLGDDADISGPEPGGSGQKRTEKLFRRAHEARCIRPQQPDTAIVADPENLGLSFVAVSAGFRKAARHHERGAGTAGRRFAKDIGRCLRRYDHRNQVDRFGDVRQRPEDIEAKHVAAAGVHRIYPAGKFFEGLHHLIARLFGGG